MGSSLAAVEVRSPALERKGPSHTHLLRPVAGVCPLHGRGRSARTMQLGLVALAMIFLSSMGHGDALMLSKARRLRRGELFPPLPLLGLLFSFLSLSLNGSIRLPHRWLSSPLSDSLWLGVSQTFNKQSTDNVLFIFSSFLFVFSNREGRHGKGVLKMCS